MRLNTPYCPPQATGEGSHHRLLIWRTGLRPVMNLTPGGKWLGMGVRGLFTRQRLRAGTPGGHRCSLSSELGVCALMRNRTNPVSCGTNSAVFLCFHDVLWGKKIVVGSFGNSSLCQFCWVTERAGILSDHGQTFKMTLLSGRHIGDGWGSQTKGSLQPPEWPWHLESENSWSVCPRMFGARKGGEKV